ncbi:ABC transporter, permease protein [Ketogulonicigenium robustum]|uniref:ABC transporter, permease protein n=2 Tax=Ketogulonicigenium robustum TaxID=92947 RepID=A0A1W6P2I2_9RHOB|nr:ABC transporter, permease protein [Ketogulonicigenium robustum]
MLLLTYHQTVNNVRKTHRNPVIALLLNIAQTLMMLAGFYVMMSVLNMKSGWLPGDFILYLLSGIFIFFTHVKAMGAVSGAMGPTSPMALHRPLNTLIVIAAAAISALYLQVLSLAVVLFMYHAIVTPVTIDNPVGAVAMLLLAWFTGVGVGMVFYALKVWFPNFSTMATNAYSRVNMIASGKMFLGNSLPAFALPLFLWNPLFHIIDQCRGFVFVNYVPRNSNWEYPLWVGVALLMIGFMGESYARRNASLSWGATR